MSKVLVLGANGMLGGSLFRFFSTHSQYEVLGTVRSDSAAKAIEEQGFSNLIKDVDISNDHILYELLEAFSPDFVINCIGLIKQLKESQAPIASIKINSLFPHRLASFCSKIDAKLIHFSTDCVFSGQKGWYNESDLPDATDLYGRSKLIGEIDYGKHLTLRTSIIGHEINSSVSLIDWLLNQSGEVKGFSKAIFSGMPTICLAEFMHEHVFANHEFSGIYHLSVDPIDKYSLLKLTSQVYQLNIKIHNSSDLKIDRSLNSTRLRKVTNYIPAKWPYLIKKMHNEYQQYFI